MWFQVEEWGGPATRLVPIVVVENASLDSMLNSQEPSWRNDPTYNLRRKRRSK